MSLPQPIGPYSLCREGGNFVFLSGQIGIDPEKGEIPENLEEEIRVLLDNVKRILGSLGLGMEDVIKTTVFLTDINVFPKLNEIYADYFTEPYPARSTVVVKSLPKNARIEIEVIALKK